MNLGYLRVSTNHQVKRGVSLTVQKELIEDQFYLMDVEDYNIIKDEGISGRKTDNREGYNRLLNHIKQGEVENLVVYSLSRLNRNLKNTLHLIELAEKNGVRIVSLYERYDSDIPASKMILYVFSGLAEQRSDEMSETIKNSIRSKKEKGLKYCKNVPIGYSVDEKGRLKENPTERKIITNIRNLITRGHSLSQIATRLNEKGYTTKKGRTWNKSSVHHYFHNYQDGILNETNTSVYTA